MSTGSFTGNGRNFGPIIRVYGADVRIGADGPQHAGNGSVSMVCIFVKTGAKILKRRLKVSTELPASCLGY